MKNTQSITRRALRALTPALALGGAALLLAPAGQSFGFSVLGTSLNVTTERDWRVFNNFADATANDNGIGSANFPGWLGAELALWKAASEWASWPHGDGTGDPTQTTVGDGGANFDFVFAGRADAQGNLNKIVSTLPSCGGTGTLAYVTNGGNFWRMRFCEEWIWSDGPGVAIGSQFDLQGVACHEFGHALGLGHTGVAGSVMVGSTPDGNDQRALGPDDQAGVQAVYNPRAANKTRITGVSVNLGGGTVTITGSNFSTTGNQVWFTNINETAPASEGKVILTGVSSTAGGTQITVSIPASAADGDVHVKRNAGGGLSLSNGWPVDLGNPPGGGPLDITAITPTTVDALIPGTAQTVTISGTGFTAGLAISLDFVPLAPGSYTVVNPTTITVDMPQVAATGPHTFLIQDGGQNDFVVINVAPPSGLVLQCGNGNPMNVVSGSFDVSVSGAPGQLHYVLYSGSNLPSVFLPYAQLEIGNNFSDLFELSTYVVNATSAVTTATLPLPATDAVFYFQSLTFALGLPLADSNVQSIHIVP